MELIRFTDLSGGLPISQTRYEAFEGPHKLVKGEWETSDPQGFIHRRLQNTIISRDNVKAWAELIFRFAMGQVLGRT